MLSYGPLAFVPPPVLHTFPFRRRTCRPLNFSLKEPLATCNSGLELQVNGKLVVLWRPYARWSGSGISVLAAVSQCKTAMKQWLTSSRTFNYS